MNYDLGQQIAKKASTKSKIDYTLYLDRFLEIAISQFKWDGLPDTVDTRYLEKVLMSNGSAVYFEDDIAGGVALGVSDLSGWDIYGIPKKRVAYGANGEQFRGLTNENSVIIWNNMLHSNDFLLLTEYAKKLQELDEIIQINAKAQKTPVLIKCNDKQRLTLKNLYRKYEGNEPFIFADDALDVSGFSVLSTGAPYLASELYELKTNIWNEALTYLGVTNIQTNKKERLITDEVTRQNGGTMASRQSRLNARKQACEEINKLFGLNASVSINDDNTTGSEGEDNTAKEEKDEDKANG
jgi:hypothetical protein